MEHPVRRLRYRTRKRHGLTSDQAWLVKEKSDRGRAVDRLFATGQSPAIDSRDEQSEWDERTAAEMDLNVIFVLAFADEMEKIALTQQQLGMMNPAVAAHMGGSPVAQPGQGVNAPLLAQMRGLPAAGAAAPAQPGLMQNLQALGGQAKGLLGGAGKNVSQFGRMMQKTVGRGYQQGGVGGALSGGLKTIMRRPGTAAGLAGAGLLAAGVGSKLLGGRGQQTVNPQTGQVVQQQPSLLRRALGGLAGLGALGAGAYGLSRLKGMAG